MVYLEIRGKHNLMVYDVKMRDYEKLKHKHHHWKHSEVISPALSLCREILCICSSQVILNSI